MSDAERISKTGDIPFDEAIETIHAQNKEIKELEAEVERLKKSAEIGKYIDQSDKIKALETENREWREVIAAVCCDGGHYHQEHGTEKTKEYCIKRWCDRSVRLDALEATLKDLKEYACEKCVEQKGICRKCWQHLVDKKCLMLETALKVVRGALEKIHKSGWSVHSEWARVALAEADRILGGGR